MRKNLTITSLLGLSEIILGAFGTYILKNKLSIEELNSFETAVSYQFYHVLVLLIVNICKEISIKTKKIISLLFFTGIMFFSGSIYLIQLTEVTAKSIWFITPLGGLFLVLGWLFMILSFIKKKSTTCT